MGISFQQRQRVLELAQELNGILGGCLDQDGRPKTFAELEEECIEVTDLLSVEVLRERVGERNPESPSPRCPGCEQVGQRDPDEPRIVQTDRGEVGWNEPAYFCRRCRKSFFPSVG
jgi:hypothetical protein